MVPGGNFWRSNQPAARPRGEGKAKIEYWDGASAAVADADAVADDDADDEDFNTWAACLYC